MNEPARAPSIRVTPIRTYLTVYLALIFLLASTYGVARLNLGRGNLLVSLGIACLKAILIALYFMHLRQAKGLTRIFAIAGVFWLGILISLALNDYLSRGWLPLPGAWPGN